MSKLKYIYTGIFLTSILLGFSYLVYHQHQQYKIELVNKKKNKINNLNTYIPLDIRFFQCEFLKSKSNNIPDNCTIPSKEFLNDIKNKDIIENFMLKAAYSDYSSYIEQYLYIRDKTDVYTKNENVNKLYDYIRSGKIMNLKEIKNVIYDINHLLITNAKKNDEKVKLKMENNKNNIIPTNNSPIINNTIHNPESIPLVSLPYTENIQDNNYSQLPENEIQNIQEENPIALLQKTARIKNQEINK